MFPYSVRQRWRIGLIIIAIMIGFGSLLYTNNLVKRLSLEERKRIELWAQATKEIDEVDLDGEVSLIVYKIIQENKNIPVMITNENGRIITSRNLDSLKTKDDNYLKDQLKIMKDQHAPIILNYPDGRKNYIYYQDSIMLTRLYNYPFFQVGVILLFIVVSYIAVRSSIKAEENQVWVGMSKETAHQLGTPISSLVAMVEMLKLREQDVTMVAEVEKDVKRLETITERFSKIGSNPVLTSGNIPLVLNNSINYLKIRTSSKINYLIHFNLNEEIYVPLNVALFDWVIENLSKNAIDAMGGSGTIEFSLTNHNKSVSIDIKDSGKGLPKSKFKTIFKPGYTTKKRGWGVGLSLAKRIIEFYHQGKIFVKYSEPNKGTTFRIILKK